MYYLGLDIGSSSIKAALVEISSGKSLGVVQEPEEEIGRQESVKSRLYMKVYIWSFFSG